MSPSVHHLRVLAAKLLTVTLLLPMTVLADQDADWALFKQRFLHAEGRVVDTGRAGISHSEGQGVAMLLAVCYDDRTAFDALWNWTRKTLQVRQDKLLAWRWSPKEGVSDMNNATDGDLFVAWALLRAHGKWKVQAYLESALQILADVRTRLIRQDKRGPVLLPGVEGFEKPEGITLNLSYWLFPALREFDQAVPDPLWEKLAQTGVTLLLEGHFGRWGLPADWIRLGDKLQPAPGFPARFGYDAVRIPLYLLWARRDTAELLRPFRDYWTHFNGARFMPAWTNLDDDSIDSWDAPPGIRAVAQLVLAQSDPAMVTLPPLDASQDYYSATLLLLSKTVQVERPALK